MPAGQIYFTNQLTGDFGPNYEVALKPHNSMVASKKFHVQPNLTQSVGFTAVFKKKTPLI